MMQNRNKVSALQKDVTHFDKSLQELRDIRSQLYNAAEFCEFTFMNSKEKKETVENTKEYVCRAMVTLVDHVGCVSDNLDDLIAKNANSFSDANLRIDCLKQRSTLYEQYNHKRALKSLQWRQIVPTYQPRYLSTHIKDTEKSDQYSSVSNNAAAMKSIRKHVSESEEKPALSSSSKEQSSSTPLLPVPGSFSITSKSPNPSFHFQEIRKIPPVAKRSRRKSSLFTLILRAKKPA